MQFNSCSDQWSPIYAKYCWLRVKSNETVIMSGYIFISLSPQSSFCQWWKNERASWWKMGIPTRSAAQNTVKPHAEDVDVHFFNRFRLQASELCRLLNNTPVRTRNVKLVAEVKGWDEYAAIPQGTVLVQSDVALWFMCGYCSLAYITQLLRCVDIRSAYIPVSNKGSHQRMIPTTRRIIDRPEWATRPETGRFGKIHWIKRSIRSTGDAVVQRERKQEVTPTHYTNWMKEIYGGQQTSATIDEYSSSVVLPLVQKARRRPPSSWRLT